MVPPFFPRNLLSGLNLWMKVSLQFFDRYRTFIKSAIFCRSLEKLDLNESDANRRIFLQIGLMTTLSDMYEKPSASYKVHLMRRLFNLRMIEGAFVAAHINEFSTIITQLSSVEIEFDDEVRVLILLFFLLES